MDPPFSWTSPSVEEKEERTRLFGENSTARDAIVSVPNNVFMPKAYTLSSNKIYNFEVRHDDIWVVTYKKCGTTWTQEIVWHIMNDLNKELGKLPLYKRSPFLERQALFSDQMINKITETLSQEETKEINHLYRNSIEYAANLSSPRIIKTHLPFDFLPQNLLETAKVIYVCRNPKDCCVSFYHHVSDIFKTLYEYNGTFDEFVQLFMDGKLEQGSYFHHLKSAWKLRDHPNMKLVWFEDMKNNPVKEVTDLSIFLNHQLKEETISELVDYLDFGNVKARASDQKKTFYRKGVVGDWKNYFQGDKLKLWDDWISKQVEGTDIQFSFNI